MFAYGNQAENGPRLDPRGQVFNFPFWSGADCQCPVVIYPESLGGWFGGWSRLWGQQTSNIDILDPFYFVNGFWGHMRNTSGGVVHYIREHTVCSSLGVSRVVSSRRAVAKCCCNAGSHNLGDGVARRWSPSGLLRKPY